MTEGGTVPGRRSKTTLSDDCTRRCTPLAGRLRGEGEVETPRGDREALSPWPLAEE